jgi:hypothetical protein
MLSAMANLLTMIVGVVTACFGWIAVHMFTSRRDIANAQRAIRNSALAEAYRAMVRAGLNGVLIYRDRDGTVVNGAKAVEDAIALVHLYGSKEQSMLATKYAETVGGGGSADLTALVDSLRKDVRSALGLSELDETPKFLKVAIRGEENHKDLAAGSQ